MDMAAQAVLSEFDEAHLKHIWQTRSALPLDLLNSAVVQKARKSALHVESHGESAHLSIATTPRLETPWRRRPTDLAATSSTGGRPPEYLGSKAFLGCF